MKNKKLLFYKILLIILLIAIVVVGILAFQKYKEQNEYEEMSSQVVEVFNQAEQKVDEAGLSIVEFKGYKVIGIIKIPKFETSFTIELNDMLKSLGMVDAFNPTKADFSSMSSHLSLYISRVLQKARIKVEEKGTEAAAVTVIDMKLTSAIPSPGEPLTFYATRPFLYTISEVSTGAILFMGQYNGN